MLVARNISGVPVTSDGRLEGMLSEKDLLRLLYDKRYLPGQVEDYMTSNVTSFDIEDRLSIVRKHLCAHSYRHAPILYQGKIAGMITRADLIRVYRTRFLPAAKESGVPLGGESRAEDVMKSGLLVVHPHTLLFDSMELITRHHITGLPVVDTARNLLGIVTEKDILKAMDQHPTDQTTVESIMTTDVVSFDRNTSLYQICACLIENSFHRVPILDGTQLVGIISRSDILRHRIENPLR
jgi:CBS domain-containing protein